MAWTTITTYVTGQLITAALANSQWGGNISHLGSLLSADGTALKDLAAGAAIADGTLVTGMMVDWWSATAPNSWLLCSGRTIGTVASSATGRANADTEGLFTFLWNNTSNTYFTIQDDGGVATTRGASAGADFAANKRFPLPDLRGRVSVGMDNTGGISANRLTAAAADAMGGSGGSEVHTQTTGETPSHSHDQLVNGTTLYQLDGGSGQSRLSTLSTGATTVQTTNFTGGGGSHANTQPWIATYKIIKM